MCGGISGLVAGLITTPIDVIKTRMMVNAIKKYTITPLEWASKIFTEEGFRGLFRGWQVRAFYLGIGGMLYFGVYVAMLRLLNADREYRHFRK